MKVRTLVAHLNRFHPDTEVVLLVVDCDKDDPSVNSYSIDEVRSEYGFVELVSVDE